MGFSFLFIEAHYYTICILGIQSLNMKMIFDISTLVIGLDEWIFYSAVICADSGIKKMYVKMIVKKEDFEQLLSSQLSKWVSWIKSSLSEPMPRVLILRAIVILWLWTPNVHTILNIKSTEL